MSSLSACLLPSPGQALQGQGWRLPALTVSLASACVLTAFPAESPLGWALSLMGKCFPS